MSDKYLLNEDHTVRTTSDLMEWARAFETSDRHVAATKLPDGTRVSTVFLGLDHSFGNGPPLLFETMIFGGKLNEEQWRYSTWDEAKAGHEKAVAQAIEAQRAETENTGSVADESAVRQDAPKGESRG